ncbi:T9SS type A sorting domain-containing protein [Psychroserpens damuponensis]|uniref:T9SS type A sorting domain-containing protein n=1 Tax=Psychroserpens damuponensis TaxID=943936 RepID=UPI00058FFD0F|nr:T9SS type A sorting domain-containing protein [Psychroserpens damuponensis]
MKQIYLLFILLFSFNLSSAQDDDLFGEWFLYHLVIDSNQVNNPSSILPAIEFWSDPINNNEFEFFGFAICSGYGGTYHFNAQQTLDIDSFTETQGNPCNTNEENLFETQYFYMVLSSNPLSELNYDITGTGEDATLVITNLLNGNQAFYGRQTLSIHENELITSEISLSRNPVANSLNLSTAQNLVGSNYDIFSISGQHVTNGVLDSNSINVNQLQSGLYFLKVSTDDAIFETVKFIKE